MLIIPQTHLFSVKEECNRKILSMRDSEKAGVDHYYFSHKTMPVLIHRFRGG